MPGQPQLKIPCLLTLADAVDHLEEEVVAALGVDELATDGTDGTLVGMHSGDVQNQPSDDGEAGGTVALAVARLPWLPLSASA